MRSSSLLYVLLCCSLCFFLSACSGGSSTRPQIPTVALSANSPSVTLGQATILTWSSTNATSCSASASSTEGDWSGSETTSGSASVTPATPGTVTYTLTCTGAGGTASHSASITVSGPAELSISSAAPPTGQVGSTYGSGFSLTASGGTKPYQWSWTNQCGSSRCSTLPPGLTLTTNADGTGSITGTPTAAGTYLVIATVSDAESPAQQANADYSILISAPPAATHFSVTAPSAVTVGSAFNFAVTALDASNNTMPSYAGTVHFTSSDSQADLPPNALLANGSGTFPAGMKTTGVQTITATDTTTASITGTTGPITVNLASAANPVPLISEPLSPAAAQPGSGAFTLAVNGTGFAPGSVVQWDGSARTTNFVSESKVTANVAPTDVANFHTALVTVVNPSPGGGKSNEVYFAVTRPTSAVALNSPQPFSTGSGPNAVVSSDFNGDGKLDLAVANSASSNVSILLGNGDGTFQAPLNLNVGSGPVSVVAGDFNGDGKLDLAVANSASNDVSILLGNGDGTFQSAVEYAADAGPQWIVSGDFNGDGKLDLAVANRLADDVSVFLGNGDGTFEPALNNTVAGAPFALAIGDFNGDGKLDLVAAIFGGQGSVLLGNGDGTFQLAGYAAGGAVSVVAGDFNGDGKLDIALGIIPEANMGPATVSVLQGNGDGTFEPPSNYSVGPNSYISSVVVGAGDLNGDGKLDLAVTTSGGEDSLSLLLNYGDGAFQTALNYPAGSVPIATAAGDFNGDGRLDLAFANATSSMVSVLLQPSLASGVNATTSPSSIAFPTQLVGTSSAPQVVQLINYGTQPLNISSISPPSNFAESDNCKSSVPAGAGCTVSVTFAPTVSGNLNGMLSIADNAPGSPHTVSLNGLATVVTLSANTLRFSCVPIIIGPLGPTCSCTRTQSLTLTNTANAALGITGITLNGPFSQNNNCPSSLGAGQSCTINVGWARVTGNGTLVINDSDAASPQTVPLEAFVQCKPSAGSAMASVSGAAACGGR